MNKIRFQIIITFQAYSTASGFLIVLLQDYPRVCHMIGDYIAKWEEY